MNRLQYLLNKLAEEGSEVSQIALKTAQFGLSEIRPGQPFTNLDRIHQELNDLLAIVDMLNEEYPFRYMRDNDAIDVKKLKVEKFYRYSVNLGLVEDS